MRLAVEGEIPLQRLITHRVEIDDFEKGMACLRDRESGCVKVVMNWGNGTC